MPNLFRDFYKDKKVLVTGHTGFKGSWLSIWLNKLGAQVTGYALEPPTTPSMFTSCGLKKKINSITADIRHFQRLQSIFKVYKPEIVFHLAAQALVRRSYKEPLATYQTNVMGIVNLLEICRKVPSVKIIVIVTSDKCYEICRQKKSGFTEDSPLGGYDPYSSSKGCAEIVTSAYLRSFFHPDDYDSHGIALASVRAGNVIGGGDWAEDRLIPDCIKAFLAKKPVLIRYPKALRPWQHVLEPLYGYLLLGYRLYKDGQRFSGAWNFGPDGRDIKPVEWLVERAARLWGDGASWRINKSKQPYESLCLKLNCNKAKTKLRWAPKWNLNTALKKTVEWHKACADKKNMFDITVKQIRSYEEEILKSNLK